MPLSAANLYMDVSFSVPMQRVDILIHGSKIFGVHYVAPDEYLASTWAGSVNVKTVNEFVKFICLDAIAQNYDCRYTGGYIQVSKKQEHKESNSSPLLDRWRVDPCNGEIKTVSLDVSDSMLNLSDSLRCPVPLMVAEKTYRALSVKVSGLTKTSARRLGLKWSDVLASIDQNSIKSLWAASAVASDSIGTLDFARSVSFAVADSGTLNFGSESRRQNSVMDLENGKSVTSFESVFDGLTLVIHGETYQLQYRQGASVLNVPSVVGFCSLGFADLKYSSKAGLPWLGSLPFVGRLFSIDQTQRDELAITVCVNEGA